MLKLKVHTKADEYIKVKQTTGSRRKALKIKSKTRCGKKKKQKKQHRSLNKKKEFSTNHC